jgi:hypothetical protein
MVLWYLAIASGIPNIDLLVFILMLMDAQGAKSDRLFKYQ